MRQDRARSAAPAMRPPRLALALVSVALACGVRAWAHQEPEVAKNQPADVVVERVCVSGTVLTVAAAAGEAGARPTLSRYRLTGARAVVKQLKAHEGHHEEVTGRVSGAFGSTGGRQVGKIGSVGIVVGAGPSAQPNAPRVPEMPSFEVKSFRHLADRCPG